MAVAPNSTVRVLRNVPIDQNYRNTLYFASTDAQYNYFVAQTKYTFTELTYQRRESSIYVQVSPDALFDCNYIMYQNTNYNTRWFYAFITAINYVNDNTAEIVFQMDVLQSWWGNWELEQCFVEREHSATDNIGDNLVPENLETGDLIAYDDLTSTGYSYLQIGVASTFNDDENLSPSFGALYGGVYSGLSINAYTDASQVNDLIERATEQSKADGIISIFMIPRESVVDIGEDPVTRTQTIDKHLNNLDGYTPKNNKLFTYPYNYLYLTDLNGNMAEFHYEYFSSSNCVFKIAGDMTPDPTLIMYPTNYKGIENNYNEKMAISGFPQCAWASDTYKAWLAQNATGTVIGSLASAGYNVGAGLSAVENKSVGGLVSASSAISGTVLSTINTFITKSFLPHQAHGQNGNSSLAALHLKAFYYAPVGIQAQFAKIIDEFFTMYGYATHRVKVPNISARPQWNYTKTIGCLVKGYCPASDIREIEQIFDNGITFWKNPANVGNYSVDNSPT